MKLKVTEAKIVDRVAIILPFYTDLVIEKQMNKRTIVYRPFAALLRAVELNLKGVRK